MSVCEHDPYCPGYGPDHVNQTKRSLSLFDSPSMLSIFEKDPSNKKPAKNPNKDRTLSGKSRRKSRKEK